MYQWYRDAAVCYAYLDDVSAEEQVSSGRTRQSKDSPDDPVDSEHSESPDGVSTLGEHFFNDGTLETSRWFTRGWTLQELIAPKNVRLFDHAWSFIGSKESIISSLVKITMIPKDVLLLRRRLDDCSIAKRMSWASLRETTRIEDEAYCLMGIFAVHMPLLYGEGANAFVRLQREIIAQCTDQSIFAWTRHMSNGRRHRNLPTLPSSRPHYLAPSPACFAFSASFEPMQHDLKSDRQGLGPRGLEIIAGMVSRGAHTSNTFIGTHPVYAVLDCFDTERCDRRLALQLNSANNLDSRSAKEFYVSSVLTVDASLARRMEIPRPITILNDPYESHTASMELRIRCFVEYEWETTVSTAGHPKASEEFSVEITRWYPEDSWDPQRALLTIHKSTQQHRPGESLKPICKFCAHLRYTPHSRAALDKIQSEVTVIACVYYDVSESSGIGTKFHLAADLESIESAWNNPNTHEYTRNDLGVNTTPLYYKESGTWNIDLVHIRPSKNDPYGSLSIAVKPLRSVRRIITNSLLIGTFAKNIGHLLLLTRPRMRTLYQEFRATAEELHGHYSKAGQINGIPPLTLKELYRSRKLWRQAHLYDILASW